MAEPRRVEPVNPVGKVPALVDGDVSLWESNAINWYIAETHPEARLLEPTPVGRASIQRWQQPRAGNQRHDRLRTRRSHVDPIQAGAGNQGTARLPG